MLKSLSNEFYNVKTNVINSVNHKTHSQFSDSVKTESRVYIADMNLGKTCMSTIGVGSQSAARGFESIAFRHSSGTPQPKKVTIISSTNQPPFTSTGVGVTS